MSTILASGQGKVGMRGLPGLIGKVGLGGLAVLGGAGIALWVADFGASSAVQPSSSPLEPFVDRFRTTLNDDAPAQPPPAWLAAASGTDQLSLFSPLPTYPATAGSFAPDTLATTTPDPTSTGSTNGSPRNANR